MTSTASHDPSTLDPSLERVRKTATRLLRSSSKNSYDPELDIDWDAPVELDMKFMPLERTSLYGTPLWERMSDEQRRELSRQEVASLASAGLWFELVLIQMLTRWAYHQDPQDPRTQYALTEIGAPTARAGSSTSSPGCTRRSRSAQRCSRRCWWPRRSPTVCNARWSTTKPCIRSSGW
jgi:hypothetical protein